MTDLKDYSKQTTKRLLFGFFGIIVLVGLGIVAFIWGIPSAISGLLCLIASGIPIFLIIVVLWVIDSIVKKSRS